MRSELPKVLHAVAGLPMYAHVTRAALEAGAERVAVVVGHGRDALVADVGARFDARVTTAEQDRQLGTGDAVRAGLVPLADFDGWVVILCGDTPLVHAGLVRELVAQIPRAPGPLVMLTTKMKDAAGYGRIVRGAEGHVLRVVEHKDASPEERAINEMNPGVYAVRAPFLREALGKLSTHNAQGELYLTDVVEQAAQAGGVSTLDWGLEDTQGVNDRAQLAACERQMRLRFVEKLLRAGVGVRDPATAYIDVTVTIEPGAMIEANVHLRGTTRIAAGAHIDTGCVLSNVQVAGGARLRPYTVASDSQIGDGAEAGPFAHLRPETIMETGSKVGNFVEVKKTRLGPRSKASHLSYLGDGQIGENVNIGAGTIFCNYDGFQKHVTVLEDDVFIGSDSQLVAPVCVGRGAYVATGTTVTMDVPADALALSRTRQVNKGGYAARLKARFQAAKEAAKRPR